jgi:hypothetical protein
MSDGEMNAYGWRLWEAGRRLWEGILPGDRGRLPVYTMLKEE